jgi:hypothetical protein
MVNTIINQFPERCAAKMWIGVIRLKDLHKFQDIRKTAVVRS